MSQKDRQANGTGELSPAEVLSLVEEQRRNIGQALHDDFGQCLVGVSLMLNVLSKRLAATDSESAARTVQMRGLLKEATGRLHTLTSCLRRLNAGSEPDLATALAQLLEQSKELFPVEYQFTNQAPKLAPCATQADRVSALAFDVIWQAVKHHRARAVEVRLQRQGSALRVEFEYETEWRPTPGEEEALPRGRLPALRAELSDILLEYHQQDRHLVVSLQWEPREVQP
jgi:signal transduction histidine kinase